MGQNERHRETKSKLSLIEAAVGPCAPSLVHAVSRPVSGNRRTRTVCIRVSCTPEDLTFLRTIAKNAHTSLGPLTARILTLLCRTIRTGRDPLTGEPIDWRLAYSLDIKIAKACTDAIEALRATPHTPNDFSQALHNCAQALDELRIIVESSRLDDRDRRKKKKYEADTASITNTEINQCHNNRSRE